jgi:hypothetical protein
MRLPVLILLFFLLLSVGAHAYIIGVSPGSQETCLATNETRLLNMTISTNATESLQLSVDSSVGWLQTWPEVQLPPAPETANLPVLFNSTNVPEGVYSSKILICAPQISGNLSIRYCLGPELTMNVTSACAMPRYDWALTFEIVATLIAIALVATAIFLRSKKKHRRRK